MTGYTSKPLDKSACERYGLSFSLLDVHLFLIHFGALYLKFYMKKTITKKFLVINKPKNAGKIEVKDLARF